MGGQISPKRAKNGVSALDKMDQIGPKMDQQGLKIVLLYQKYFFFSSEEIILNEVSLGGSPAISAALL